jgi:hypothetical protein
MIGESLILYLQMKGVQHWKKRKEDGDAGRRREDCGSVREKVFTGTVARPVFRWLVYLLPIACMISLVLTARGESLDASARR